MILVEEALGRVLALVGRLPEEAVPLDRAAGRYMPQPAIATCDQPPFDSSAMDGYALIGPASGGDRFRIIGMAAAGHAFAGELGMRQAVRIFTGAPLPAGATQVVIQEDVTTEGDTISIRADVETGINIRAAGQDFRRGDALPPRQLRPGDLALLAAMNIAKVQVSRRPVVAIIPTGDELIMPGRPLDPSRSSRPTSLPSRRWPKQKGRRCAFCRSPRTRKRHWLPSSTLPGVPIWL